MLSIHTVPDLRLSLNGSAVTGLVNTKGGAIALYLALSSGSAPRTRIANLLWSDLAHDEALNNLRFTLSTLRRQLPGVIVATRHDIAFENTLTWEVDVLAQDAAQDLALLDLRVEDFLANLHPPNATAFQDWIAETRADLSRRYFARMERIAHGLEQDSRPDLAAQGYRRCLAIEPWSESLHRALARLYADKGDDAGALAQLMSCREVLRRELDVAPEQETEALEAAIRARRHPATAPEKRRARPRNPPSHDLRPDAHVLHDVGMVAERARLRDLILSPGSRIVSVLGPGGAGKSHLAGIVARALADRFDHGLTVVRFDDVEGTGRGTALVLSRLAAALGCDLVPGREMRSLAETLRERRQIMLVDNFETVADAAPALVALSEQAPGVKFLVTSRHQLGIATEWVLRIDGLDWPRTGPWQAGFEDAPAVALFLLSAARMGLPIDTAADGDAVVRICAALEGWPLGILLASSWLPIQGCAEIASSLETDTGILLGSAPALVAPRHQSAALVLDRSWRLLNSELERTGFAALCVFAGRFNVADAQAVAGVGPQGLAALVAKSMVRREAAGDLSIHPLLREFGQRRLEEDPARRAAVHAAHRARSETALSAARAAFDRDGDPGAYDRAAGMLGDHLAVFRRMATDPGTDTATKAGSLAAFVGDLWQLYRVRGWIEDGLALLQQALALPGLPRGLAPQWQLWRSDALFQLGRIEASDAAARDVLSALGERSPGVTGAAQITVGLARLILGLPRRRPGGAEAILATRAWNRLGQVHFFAGDRQAFVASTLRAVTYRGANAMPANLASSALLLNYTPFQSSAGALVRKAQERLSAADPFDRAWTHELIALHSLGRGAVDEARVHAIAGADIFRRLGQRRNWAECQALAAYCHCFRGDLDQTGAEMRALSMHGAQVRDAASELWGALGALFVDLSQGGTGMAADTVRYRLLADEVPDPNTSLLLHGNLAWQAARQGRRRDAAIERDRWDAAFRSASMLSVYALNGFIADFNALRLLGFEGDAGPSARATLRRFRRFAADFPAARPFLAQATAALHPSADLERDRGRSA